MGWSRPRAQVVGISSQVVGISSQVAGISSQVAGISSHAQPRGVRVRVWAGSLQSLEGWPEERNYHDYVRPRKVPEPPEQDLEHFLRENLSVLTRVWKGGRKREIIMIIFAPGRAQSRQSRIWSIL